LSRSRLRQWDVRIFTHKDGSSVHRLVSSIAMHTAVTRAINLHWPDELAPVEARIEVRCLEAKFPPVPFELSDGVAGQLDEAQAEAARGL